MTARFDAIIIGAGQAGPALAGRLTKGGMKVALIERKLLGGTCVNTGCIPTKALLASAYAAHLAGRGREYGVAIAGPIAIDMKQVHARTDRIRTNARANVEKWLGKMEGLTLIHGHARFERPDSIWVNGDVLRAPRIFINVGGRPTIPNMPGVDTVPFLTSTTMLDLACVPQHLIVVGGSYIGLEFAQIFRRLGAEVTIIERMPRLIPREDEDVSQAIEEILTAEGIEIRTSATCIELHLHRDGVAVTADCSTGDPVVTGSHVLLAVGRRPNTDDLDLDKASITVDARGYIPVDDGLSTNMAGIWALGDCNGRGAFTHTAYNDFEIVTANLLDGDQRRVSERIPGYALYIDPPLGRVGMTEAEALKSGCNVLVSKRPMARVGRAIERGETQGFIKIVADADTKQILGAAVLGVTGDEVIHGILNMMNAKAPFPTLQRAVPVHPTVSELIPTVLGDLKPVGQDLWS